MKIFFKNLANRTTNVSGVYQLDFYDQESRPVHAKILRCIQPVQIDRKKAFINACFSFNSLSSASVPGNCWFRSCTKLSLQQIPRMLVTIGRRWSNRMHRSLAFSGVPMDSMQMNTLVKRDLILAMKSRTWSSTNLENTILILKK